MTRPSFILYCLLVVPFCFGATLFRRLVTASIICFAIVSYARTGHRIPVGYGTAGIAIRPISYLILAWDSNYTNGAVLSVVMSKTNLLEPWTIRQVAATNRFVAPKDKQSEFFTVTNRWG